MDDDKKLLYSLKLSLRVLHVGFLLIIFNSYLTKTELRVLTGILLCLFPFMF